MALRVAVQYMARVNPEVADRAVDVAYGHEPNEQRKTHGLKSVQHLFSAGAQFLKRFAPPRLLPHLWQMFSISCSADQISQGQPTQRSVSYCSREPFHGRVQWPPLSDKTWRGSRRYTDRQWPCLMAASAPCKLDCVIIQRQAIHNKLHTFIAGNGSGVNIQSARQCRVPQGMPYT